MLASIGCAVMFAGAAWFKLTISLASMGFALLTLLVGVVVFSLAHVGVEAGRVVEQNVG